MVGVRRGIRLLSAVLLTLGLLLLLGTGGSWWAGSQLSAVRPTVVGAPPTWLAAQTVTIPSASGSRLSGWFAPGDPARGAVLLLHANGADRRSMLGRARFLGTAGYSLLLIDFQGQGESPGRHRTWGHLEARDAEAALGWLQKRLPGRPLGLIGTSLGGAAALLGQTAKQADALVLEAVYGDFETAIANRLELRLGRPGRLFTPLLLWQVQPRLGFDPRILAPAGRIASVDTPVLIIGGSADARATPAETHNLHAAALGPKSLWLLEGAAHQDFHAFAPMEYERRILAFFRRYLHSG